MTTFLAFALALGVLIVVHEYAHYRVAVACGVKVIRFSIGFGQVVWRYQRAPGATEFALSMIPLGGYVSMLDDPSHPGEVGMALNRKSLWQRSAIVAAGPLSNLVLAVCLYSAVNWIGTEEPKARIATPVAESLAAKAGLKAGDEVHALSSDGSSWSDVRSLTDVHWAIVYAVIDAEPLHLLVSSGPGQGQRAVVLDIDTLGSRDIDGATMRRVGPVAPARDTLIVKVLKDGAAARAGLLDGDRVLSIDDQRVQDAGEMFDMIRGNTTAQPMLWLVERSGQRVELTVRPEPFTQNGKTIGRIGAELGGPAEVVTVSYGLWDGFSTAVERTWKISRLTLKMLWRVVTFQASLKNISGPATMADYAGRSAEKGLTTYLAFLAAVSVSLGVLNLLPVPMLDGGHLMYYLFEAVTGRPPSDAWRDRLQRGGFAILVMMMSLAFYNDVVRYLGPH